MFIYINMCVCVCVYYEGGTGSRVEKISVKFRMVTYSNYYTRDLFYSGHAIPGSNT